MTQLCIKGADINAQATLSLKTALMWGKNQSITIYLQIFKYLNYSII